MTSIIGSDVNMELKIVVWIFNLNSLYTRVFQLKNKSFLNYRGVSNLYYKEIIKILL